MSDEAITHMWLAVIIFMVGVACGLMFGVPRGEELKGEEAVKKGHAEYYLDANHNKQWRWKEAK